MPEESAARRRPGQLAPVLIAGLAIGWLAGLSLSPVVATILTAVMAAVGAVVAGLASAGNPNAPKVNAWPAAVLVLGVAFGGPAGILARTHNVFGTGGLDRSTTMSSNSSAKASDPALGGLFTGPSPADECKRLLGTPDQALAGALDISRFHWGSKLVRKFQDPKTLRSVVECICNETP